MSIKARLTKLESTIPTKTERLRVGRFILDPGNTEPVGYKCDDVEMIRQPDESIDDLQTRCFDAVQWTDDIERHIFIPLYG